MTDPDLYEIPSIQLNEIDRTDTDLGRTRLDYRFAFLATAIAAVIIYALATGVAYKQHHLAVRAHNLDVFYKSLTCDDLPTDVTRCQTAIGQFMIPESGLFTR